MVMATPARRRFFEARPEQPQLPNEIVIPGVGRIEVDWIVVGQAIDAQNRSVLILAPTPAFDQLTPQLSAALFNSIRAVDQETGNLLDEFAAREVIAGASSISTGRGLTPDDVFGQISNRAFVDTVINAGLDERLLGFTRTQELLAAAFDLAARGIRVDPQRIARDILSASQDPEFRSPLLEEGQPREGEAGFAPQAAAGVAGAPVGAPAVDPLQRDIAEVFRNLRGQQFETEEARVQATIDLLSPLVGVQVGLRQAPPEGIPGLAEVARGLPTIEQIPAGGARGAFSEAMRELQAAQTGGQLTLSARAGAESLAAQFGAQERGIAQATRSRQQQQFEELSRRSRARAQRRTAI